MKLLKQKIAVLLIVVMALAAPLTSFAATRFAVDKPEFTPFITSEDDDDDENGIASILGWSRSRSVATASVETPSVPLATVSTPSVASASDLKEAYDAAREKESGDYTAESWEAVEDALQELIELLIADDPDWKAINEAVQKLNAAVDALVVETPSDALATLSEAVEKAEAEELNEEDYTADSWAALQEALEAAHAVLDKENAKLSEVKDALAALQDAMNNLVKKTTTPSDATPSTATLSDAIAQAEKLNEEDYTAESWEALQKALEEAKAVLADEDATQDEIDAATEALLAAIEALVLAEEEEPVTPTPDDDKDDSGNEGSGSGSGTVEDSIDTSALEAAIATAEGLSSSTYTTATWTALQTALANAKAVLANENATQDEIDEATEALLAAINALRRKTTHSSSGGGGGSSSSSVSTSTSGSWQHDGIGWWYQYTNGGYPKSSWLSIGGQWYYFNDEGYACYGWQKVNGLWYYLDPTNCNMLSGWHEDPQDGYWYYLNPSDGRMLTNWQQIGDVYYFFNPIEPEEPTWTYDSDNSEWNYTNDNHRPFGSMYAGETTPDGYEVDENGAWIQ